MNYNHSTKLATIAAGLSLALFGAGCSGEVKPVAPEVQPIPVETAPPSSAVPSPVTAPAVAPVVKTGISRTVWFKAVGDSKITGSSVFLETKDGLRVTTSLKNTESGKVYTANIESGSCAQRGSTNYALKDLIKGYSVTILNDLRLEHIFTKDKVLSIKVKPSNDAPYASCADIR